jgi:4-hydroxy-tetrahydrodipicolinate reductase
MQALGKESWVLVDDFQPPYPSQIPIKALREDPAPGTHTVNYRSSIDDLTITHTAHTREGFAMGAVVAAAWLADKKGVHTMQDVLFNH